MEVILKQDVSKLGHAGAVIKVKDGYARNFLFPNNLALPVNAANLKKLEEEKQSKALHWEKEKKEAAELKERLDHFSLTLPVLAQEDEKIYGSITAQEIASALKDDGYAIDKHALLIEEPIKALGIYEVPVRLHPEITAKIKIWVVKK